MSGSSAIAPNVQTGEQALRPLFGVCVGFIVVDTVFLALRFYTVLYLRRKRLALTWDDWLLIPAYLLNLSMLINGLVIQQYGIKNHTLAGASITDPNLNVPVWKALFVLTQLKNPSFAFTRFSLLALFLRIFRGRPVRWTCWALIAFIIAQTVAYNIAGVVQCLPVEYFWTQGYNDGRAGSCFDYNLFYRALVPPEIFVDVVLIFLPLPEIWRLKSSHARKLGLTTLFLSGCIALMSNCVRLSSYWHHTIPLHYPAPSVLNAIVAWCNAEMSCCFIVACLPTMHPLFQHVVPSSVREEVRRRVPFGRHRAPKDEMLASNGSGSGFRKLVESNGGSITPAFGQPNTYGAQAHGTGDISELERLGKVKGGEGVLVTTEITVTQEEVMEDILGF